MKKKGKNIDEDTEKMRARCQAMSEKSGESRRDDERMANGCMRVPLLALLWILLRAHMALEEEIPTPQEMRHAVVTVPDPRGGKRQGKR